MSGKTYFQIDWLTIPQFKAWLSAGKKVLKLTVKDVPRRLNHQIWEYKQLKIMQQVNLLYFFHALCCKIKV